MELREKLLYDVKKIAFYLGCPNQNFRTKTCDFDDVRPTFGNSNHPDYRLVNIFAEQTRDMTWDRKYSTGMDIRLWLSETGAALYCANNGIVWDFFEKQPAGYMRVPNRTAFIRQRLAPVLVRDNLTPLGFAHNPFRRLVDCEIVNYGDLWDCWYLLEKHFEKLVCGGGVNPAGYGDALRGVDVLRQAGLRDVAANRRRLCRAVKREAAGERRIIRDGRGLYRIKNGWRTRLHEVLGMI